MRPQVVKPPPRKVERVSEYFDFDQWPELADRKVTRIELLGILTQHHRLMREDHWWRRLRRWGQRYYARSATAPLAEVKDA